MIYGDYSMGAQLPAGSMVEMRLTSFWLSGQMGQETWFDSNSHQNL